MQSATCSRQLLSGVGVTSSHLDSDALSRRVRLSAGVTVCQSDDGVYSPGAVLPRVPFREVSGDEWSRLCGAQEQTVRLVRIPEAAKELLNRLRLEKVTDPASLDRLHRSRRYVDTMWKLGMAVSEIFEPSNTRPGIFLNQPGLLTSTYDSPTSRYVGLHIDAFHGTMPGPGERRPGRITMNVGAELRSFLMVNMSFDQIVRQPVIAALGQGRFDKTDVVRIFCEHFSDYPVTAISIEPGEAYIAETERLIHDGSTLGQKLPGLTAVVHGYVH